MTGCTFRRRPLKTACVTLQTIGSLVGTRQWERSGIMVENIACAPSWVAGKTSITLINITAHSCMLVICFGIRMAGRAGIFCIVGWIRMAISALTPFTVVCATVNGKILRIMVKCSRRPGCFGMAGNTF